MIAFAGQITRVAMSNRVSFLKQQALPALYLGAAFYLCTLIVYTLDSHFYELRPNILSDIADALFLFFAPALVVVLAIDGNPHAPNALLLFIFGFAQAYLIGLIIVMSVRAIRRRATSRRAAR
jgi:hypothetical protein